MTVDADKQLVMDLVWKIAEAKGLVQTTSSNPPVRTIITERNYLLELQKHLQNAVNIPVP